MTPHPTLQKKKIDNFLETIEVLLKKLDVFVFIFCILFVSSNYVQSKNTTQPNIIWEQEKCNDSISATDSTWMWQQRHWYFQEGGDDTDTSKKVATDVVHLWHCQWAGFSKFEKQIKWNKEEKKTVKIILNDTNWSGKTIILKSRSNLK